MLLVVGTSTKVMLLAILICAFMVKHAATQTVTASLGTTKECFVEGRDDVKLLCTVSSGCCSSARVWQKVGPSTSLLHNGGSSDTSKYVEDYAGGGTLGGPIEFNLIIKDVQKSDFGVKYKCQYSVYSSNELYLNGTLCDCWECAGKDYGWSILGTVIGTVIILIIVIVKIGKPKTVLIVGGLTFIISAVVNLFALLIGYYKCHCVDGTDPWFILLGLGTSGTTCGIATYKLKEDTTISWTFHRSEHQARMEPTFVLKLSRGIPLALSTVRRCLEKKSKQDDGQELKEEDYDFQTL